MYATPARMTLTLFILALSAGCEVHTVPDYGPGFHDDVVYTSPAPAPRTPATYTPIGVDSSCGPVSDAGLCDGGVLQFCEQGTLYTYDCYEYGMTCGYDSAQNWYDCMQPGTTPADPVVVVEGCTVGAEGACGYDILTYCDNGLEVDVDCAARGELCDWVPEKGWYDCVDPGFTPIPEPSGCGLLTSEGACAGDVLEYCSGDSITVSDCAASGLTCGYDAAAGYYNCVEPVVVIVDDDPCAGVTYEGMCDYDEVVWCESGQLEAKSCAMGCGWDAAAGVYDCLPEEVVVVDECGDIGYEGLCDGDELLYCDNGSLQSQSCAFGCGWDAVNSYYDCL